MVKEDKDDGVFPKGENAPAEYFSGQAWLNILVAKDSSGNYSVGEVRFEPGCRNNWHTHPAGQILLVTSGSGYYQEIGKPSRLIVKGDVVDIPPGLVHWHGAAKDIGMSHIAITNITEEGAVKWLLSVTDEEYESAHNSSDT